jgi:hypothetical protein
MFLGKKNSMNRAETSSFAHLYLHKNLIKIWPMKMLYFLKLDQSNWNYICIIIHLFH